MHNRKPIRNTNDKFLGRRLRDFVLTRQIVDDAEKVPGFIPTRDELQQLAKDWLLRSLQIQFSWFVNRSVTDAERRLQAFAEARVEMIQDCLGEHELDTIIAEVLTAFAAEHAGPDWEEFIDRAGNELKDLEWEAFMHEIYASDVPKRRDRAAGADLPMQ